MKETYFKCIRNPYGKGERKLEAEGTKVFFKKDDKVIIGYYDSEQRMFTERTTGKIINSHLCNSKKEAESNVYENFDVIFNNIGRFVPVLQLKGV